jgi:hypothetical protein
MTAADGAQFTLPTCCRPARFRKAAIRIRGSALATVTKFDMAISTAPSGTLFECADLPTFTRSRAMRFKNPIAALTLALVLGLPAFAADAPAGLEDAPKEMLRQSVLSDRNGKFEIGIPNLDVRWYRTMQTKYPTYAAINQAARRVYTVAYFPKETGDVWEQIVPGAFEGVRRWAVHNKAVVQNTSTETSDIPYPNSKRLYAEGKLANGAPFYAVQYIVVTDAIIYNVGTYALNQPDVQDFAKFVSSFKVMK